MCSMALNQLDFNRNSIEFSNQANIHVRVHSCIQTIELLNNDESFEISMYTWEFNSFLHGISIHSRKFYTFNIYIQRIFVVLFSCIIWSYSFYIFAWIQSHALAWESRNEIKWSTQKAEIYYTIYFHHVISHTTSKRWEIFYRVQEQNVRTKILKARAITFKM